MRLYYTLSDYPHEMVESAISVVATVGCANQ